MDKDVRPGSAISEKGNLYFAPMEGITGHIYRSAHRKHFGGIDKYYLPFLAAHATHTMKNKEKKDVSPANNAGLCAVPQVLTKSADDFLWALEELIKMGYREVNLNLGCPSPTVTSRGRGAAFLGDLDGLDRFFDTVFEGMGRMGISASRPAVGGSEKVSYGERIHISVKTRIGVDEANEWERIFAIYNRYPISELIVHARTLREYYNGLAHPDVFEEILKRSHIPACYNGNIYTKGDYEAVTERFGGNPMFSGVMIGRGLVRNPALAREIRGRFGLGEEEFAGHREHGRCSSGQLGIARGLPCQTRNYEHGRCFSGKPGINAEELLHFHDEVLAGYRRELSGDTHVISKMKELWHYMGDLFAEADRPLKRLKKTKNVRDYEAAVREVLRCPFKVT
ncbi:MAG: tRNA-dihydrouridine synthase family protein [Lachnospiraceae bacterium]|nr:tRNA-dihydrouridine synthase family protein [Lachnospiraceae bacterium]